MGQAQAIPGIVFPLVLFAALLHASWNALLKRGGNVFANAVLVQLGCGAISAAILPFLPLPAPASWPWLVPSVAAQIAYYVLLIATYRAGEMGEAYPVMRGAAPLIVTLASGPVLGEHLPPIAWGGIGLICGGVLLLRFDRPAAARRLGRGTACALGTAAMIATYTVIDGIGVRRSGSPAAYALWSFLLTALPILAWTLARRRRDLLAHLPARLPLALLGGAGTAGAYGIVLWAMTMAPVAVVAALRETSILFAAAIAALFLKERPGPFRMAATGVIAMGAVLIRTV